MNEPRRCWSLRGTLDLTFDLGIGGSRTRLPAFSRVSRFRDKEQLVPFPTSKISAWLPLVVCAVAAIVSVWMRAAIPMEIRLGAPYDDGLQVRSHIR